MKGLFITLESSEGAGKGTARPFIDDCLTLSGHRTTLTREPGGTPMAERIRELLLCIDEEQLCPMSELLLVYASRAQHLDQVIEPHIAKGNIVLCERFNDTSYAYQHFARGMPRAHIDGLVKLLDCRTPDLTFYLDIDPVVGMARAAGRAALDRFESEAMDFFHRVREGFLSRVAEDTTGRFRIIDAEKSLPEVRRQFIDHLVAADLMTTEAVKIIEGKYDVASWK